MRKFFIDTKLSELHKDTVLVRPKRTDRVFATGFAMIETLVGLSIAAILLVSFTTLIAQSAKISRTNTRELKANLYLRETLEAAKDLEHSNWAALGNPLCLFPLSCHPQISGTAWTLASGNGALDDGTYTRSLSTVPVYRDAVTNLIVPTPGVLDPNTKKVIASIIWNTAYGNRTMTLETYVYKP